MSGVSNAVIKQAVVDAAIGIEAHSEMLAEKGLAHANEKAGDMPRSGQAKEITGQGSRTGFADEGWPSRARRAGARLYWTLRREARCPRREARALPLDRVDLRGLDAVGLLAGHEALDLLRLLIGDPLLHGVPERPGVLDRHLR